MVGSKTALFDTFMDSIYAWPENSLFECFYIGAGGLEIAKSREMAWGRHSIQFPKHSAMPGGCLAEHQRTRISGLPDPLIF